MSTSQPTQPPAPRIVLGHGRQGYFINSQLGRMAYCRTFSDHVWLLNQSWGVDFYSRCKTWNYHQDHCHCRLWFPELVFSRGPNIRINAGHCHQFSLRKTCSRNAIDQESEEKQLAVGQSWAELDSNGHFLIASTYMESLHLFCRPAPPCSISFVFGKGPNVN